VLLGDNFVVALSRGEVLSSSLVFYQPTSPGLERLTNLELIAERFIIEENPWIVVLAVPLEFQLTHALHQTRKLRVADQTDQGSARFGRVMAQGWKGIQ